MYYTEKRSFTSSVLFKCLLLVFFLQIFTVAAQDIEVIRVGYSPSRGNLISDIDSITAKGYGYDLFKKMEEISNIRFEYVPIEGRLTDAVNAGLVDIAGLILKSPEVEKKVYFSETPIGKTFSVLVSKNKSYIYNDPATMNGKTVATHRDDPAQANLNLYCKENGISINYVYGDYANYMDLEADYYIAYSQHKKLENMKNVLNLGVHHLYVVSNFSFADTMDRLASVFYKMLLSEGNFVLELEEKYVGKDIGFNHRSLNPQEIAKLQERPLEVGYVADYRPISYTDKDGNANGSMVETLNLFAEQYNFKINYHPYSIYDDPSLHENFDVLVTLYGDSTHDSEFYDTTEEYYTMPLYAQVPLDTFKKTTSTRELIESSPRIGMLEYQLLDYDLFLKAFPNNEIIFYKGWHTLLDDFADRKVDILLATETAAAYAEVYLENAKTVGIHTDAEVPMKFLISKKISRDYLPIFNVMMDTVSNAEYASIINKHANAFFPDVTVKEFIKDNLLLVLFCIVLGLGTIYAFSYAQEKRKKASIEKAYNFDSLTGHMSPPYFRKKAEELLQTAEANEYEIISIDIDLFKTINAYFGMQTGTDVIKALGEGLKNSLRGTNALIKRRSVDQYIILRKVSEGLHLREMYSIYILPEIRSVIGENFNLSLSFGTYRVTECCEKIDTICGYADVARVRGKKVHKTTFITFDEKMKKEFEDRLNVTFRMEQAIKNREFKAVYQPKIDFSTLQVEGAEALVRWFPKDGKTIYPDSFIPVFEKNGFIVELDMYVLEEVCAFIAKNKKNIDIPRISVNLSSLTATNENLIDKVTSILHRFSVSPSEIEFEITESAIEENKVAFMAHVRELKSLGFAISIDDFGVGVSSLHRISAIDADILKLDKSFFDLKDDDIKSSIVVEDVITMGKHLDMKIVAEGVETAEQALWLKSIKCDYAQGYYFEKPMDEEAFRTALSEQKVYDIMPSEVLIYKE